MAMIALYVEKQELQEEGVGLAAPSAREMSDERRKQPLDLATRRSLCNHGRYCGVVEVENQIVGKRGCWEAHNSRLRNVDSSVKKKTWLCRERERMEPERGEDKGNLPHKCHNFYLNESLQKFNKQNFSLKLTQLAINTIHQEIAHINFETNKN